MKKDKLQSIAFPAIGTGNLNFPREEVAKIFFEEVTSYVTGCSLPTINIHFVVFKGDQATVDVFKGV